MLLCNVLFMSCKLWQRTVKRNFDSKGLVYNLSYCYLFIAALNHVLCNVTYVDIRRVACN